MDKVDLERLKEWLPEKIDAPFLRTVCASPFYSAVEKAMAQELIALREELPIIHRWFSQSLRQWKSYSDDASEERDISNDDDTKAEWYRIAHSICQKLWQRINA